MPLVLDYNETGAITGGHCFSYIPEGAVESGAWHVVVPGVYARLTHAITALMRPRERSAQTPALAPMLYGHTGGAEAVGGADVLPQTAEMVQGGGEGRLVSSLGGGEGVAGPDADPMEVEKVTGAASVEKVAAEVIRH